MATPALLTAGKTAPRTVIGSVDTSEFLVALAASIGFLIGLGSAVLDPWTIGGLLLGGVLAAPLAAWLVTKIPAPVLGTAVGGIIVLTNTRTILRSLDVTGWASTTIYLVDRRGLGGRGRHRLRQAAAGGRRRARHRARCRGGHGAGRRDGPGLKAGASADEAPGSGPRSGRE